VPRGPCPPAASADRVLLPLCGAIKQQASKVCRELPPNFIEKMLLKMVMMSCGPCSSAEVWLPSLCVKL
jgi:hypothetical protein